MTRIAAAAAVLLAAWLAAPAAPAAPDDATVTGTLTAEGTEFVLEAPAGDELRSPDLVGERVRMDVDGEDLLVTIEAVEEDVAVGGTVFLHRLTIEDPVTGVRRDLCSPDPDGRRMGFPLDDGLGGWELTCTSGAVGKCVRAGYRPWEESDGGPPLRDLHAACVHMFRADYGGDGQTHTRDGTQIAWCDRHDVVPCRDWPGTFEAGWGVAGATCVARPRIAEVIDLEMLAARYPHLSELTGDRCTAEVALADPATLLLNHSGLPSPGRSRLRQAAIGVGVGLLLLAVLVAGRGRRWRRGKSSGA